VKRSNPPRRLAPCPFSPGRSYAVVDRRGTSGEGGLVLRCTNRWHLLAPALMPASSRWVPLLGGARVRHIALAARAEKGASANAPALSVSCSPGAYYLPRRDRDRDVPARVALLRCGRPGRWRRGASWLPPLPSGSCAARCQSDQTGRALKFDLRRPAGIVQISSLSRTTFDLFSTAPYVRAGR
jgi:hypothetical protein